MAHIQRKDLVVGMLVEIDCQNDIIRGYIKDVITKTNEASRVKVQLRTDEVGYVDHLVTRDEMKLEQLKYYNQFLYEKTMLSIWDKQDNAYLITPEYNERKGTEERFAYLFTDNDLAETVLATLNAKRYMLKSINRNKRIGENFKTLDYTHYRINEERKITIKNLNEREKEFILTTPNRKGKKKR